MWFDLINLNCNILYSLFTIHYSVFIVFLQRFLIYFVWKLTSVEYLVYLIYSALHNLWWCPWIWVEKWKNKLPGGDKRGFNPPQIFKPKKTLKRSIINAFSCVVLIPSNLALRHLKVLNFYFFPPANHYQLKCPKYCDNLRRKNYSWLHRLGGRYYVPDATALKCIWNFDIVLVTMFKQEKAFQRSYHCVKSVQIRSYFWSVFNPNAGKCGPKKTPYLDTFHTVYK